MRFRLKAVLAAVLLTGVGLTGMVPPVCAHDPVLLLAPDPKQKNVESPQLEHYYRLFSDLCQRYPTPRQNEVLKQAERIYSVVWLPRPMPPGADEVKKAEADARVFYSALKQEYAVVRAEWVGDAARSIGGCGGMAPLELARGLTRGALLEVTNRNPAPITLYPTLGDARAGIAPPLTIPPGEQRTFILPLLAAAKTDVLTVHLVPEGKPEAASPLTVPVVVREPAVLLGEIQESDGKPFPGRLHVRCSDGQLRHGKAYAANTTLSEKPVVFRPASYKLPFFYSDGRFEILTPSGDTEITLERGFEHPLVAQKLTLKPGERRTVTLKSTRFLDMKRRGWISGDTHVHWVKNSWDTNESLSLLGVVQRAEDVRVINNLTLYQYRPAEQGGTFIKPDHHPMGPVPGMCDGDWHVQMGEEYRNDNHYGHINLLGITNLIQPIAAGPGSGGPPDALDYPINRTAIREARRQGGINIDAHNLGPFYTSDVPVNVALGLSDSLDQLEPAFYYRFLNSGFHIGLTNGSDHPARVVGVVRAYVRTEMPFTYRRWLDGVRKGRTFTTSGPLVFLTVNGREIGETLDCQPDALLTVKAHVESRLPVGKFEIVSNGEVLKSVTLTGRKGELTTRVRADKSRWFTVRASRTGDFFVMNGPDIAHSSAVYARVQGQEVLRSEDLRFWIDNLNQHTERIRKFGNFANDAQRNEALAHVAEGLAVYRTRLAEAERREAAERKPHAVP